MLGFALQYSLKLPFVRTRKEQEPLLKRLRAVVLVRRGRQTAQSTQS